MGSCRPDVIRPTGFLLEISENKKREKTDTTEYAAMLFITNAARTYLRIYKRAYCLAEHIWKEYMDSRQNLLSF